MSTKRFNQEKTTLIKHSIYGMLARYNDDQISAHALLNRIVLLTQKQLDFAILSEENELIFHSVNSPDFSRAFIETIKSSIAEFKKIASYPKAIYIPFQKENERTPKNNFYLVMARLDNKRSFEILGDNDESFCITKKILSDIEKDDYTFSFGSSRYFLSRLSNMLFMARHKLDKRCEYYRRNKRFINERNNKENINNIIEPIRESIQTLFDDIKEAPILNKTQNSSTGNITNILFFQRTATSERLNGLFPYEIRLLLPESQSLQIEKHYEHLLKSPKNNCPFHSEKPTKCNLLKIKNGCVLQQKIFEFNEKLESLENVFKNNEKQGKSLFLETLKHPFGEYRSMTDSVFVNGLIDISDNIATDPRAEFNSNRDIKNLEYRRHLFTHCLLHQISLSNTKPASTPGLFMAPLRISNTTMMVALTVIPKTPKNRIAYKQWWLDNYNFYQMIISKHFNRKIRTLIRDIYINELKKVFENLLIKHSEEKPNSEKKNYILKDIKECFDEINNQFSSLCQIYPYDQVRLLCVDKNQNTEAIDREIYQNKYIYKETEELYFLSKNDKLIIMLLENSHFIRNSLRQDTYLKAKRVKRALSEVLEDLLTKIIAQKSNHVK